MDCHAVNALSSRSDVDTAMMATLDRVDTMIRGSKAFIATFSGDPVKLVVLPEYFMTGFPMGESIAAWRDKACIAMDGPEYDRLGQIASQHGVYLSGNAYEIDPHFSDLYFQTSFIISDEGDVVLRYRRLISMFAPTPHDVLTKYLDIYGKEGLFPVVDTPGPTGLCRVRGDPVPGNSPRARAPRCRGFTAFIQRSRQPTTHTQEHREVRKGL